jgi:hypothetical protein
LKAYLSCAVVVVALFSAFGCGGGSGDDVFPTPTPDTFDPNVMSALVLQPDEVGGLPLAVQGYVQVEGGSSYRSEYDDGKLQVQSQVFRVADPIERELLFTSTRQAVGGFAAFESNLNLPEADRAFWYLAGATPAAAFERTAIVLRGEFFFVAAIRSSDDSTDVLVDDETVLRGYVDLIMERIGEAIADPGSVTPPAGAPTYAPVS